MTATTANGSNNFQKFLFTLLAVGIIVITIIGIQAIRSAPAKTQESAEGGSVASTSTKWTLTVDQQFAGLDITSGASIKIAYESTTVILSCKNDPGSGGSKYFGSVQNEEGFNLLYPGQPNNENFDPNPCSPNRFAAWLVVITTRLEELLGKENAKEVIQTANSWINLIPK